MQSRAVRNAQKLLHDCSELEGLLQARSKVELEVLNAELPAPGDEVVAGNPRWPTFRFLIRLLVGVG